jgi:hypothetical protein
MKNLLFTLLITVALCGAYLAGRHGAETDRAALTAAIVAGEQADIALKALVEKQKTGASAIGVQAEAKLAANQRDFEARSRQWQREKAGLEQRIAGLQTTIARNRQESGQSADQLAGNLCLKTRLPPAVFEALRPLP